MAYKCDSIRTCVLLCNFFEEAIAYTKFVEIVKDRERNKRYISHETRGF